MITSKNPTQTSTQLALAPRFFEECQTEAVCNFSPQKTPQKESGLTIDNIDPSSILPCHVPVDQLISTKRAHNR
jgi:hypothetical protein